MYDPQSPREVAENIAGEMLEYFEESGYTVKVSYDSYADDPRRDFYENLGTMCCWHDVYCLGDQIADYDDQSVVRPPTREEIFADICPDGVAEEAHRIYQIAQDYTNARYGENDIDYAGIEEERHAELYEEALFAAATTTNVILRTYAQSAEDGTIRMSTAPMSQKRSDCLVGYIWVSHAEIKAEFGLKKLTRSRIAKVKEILRKEVSDYDLYLRGETYRYAILVGSTSTDPDWCISEAKCVGRGFNINDPIKAMRMGRDAAIELSKENSK